MRGMMLILKKISSHILLFLNQEVYHSNYKKKIIVLGNCDIVSLTRVFGPNALLRLFETKPNLIIHKMGNIFWI